VATDGPRGACLHDQLIRLRNKLYAHTDGESRVIVRRDNPDYETFGKGRRVAVYGGESLDMAAVEALAARLADEMDEFLTA